MFQFALLWKCALMLEADWQLNSIWKFRVREGSLCCHLNWELAALKVEGVALLSTMSSGRECCSQKEGLTVDMMSMDVMQRYLGTGAWVSSSWVPSFLSFFLSWVPQWILVHTHPKARFNAFLILGTKWAFNTKGIEPSKSWQQQKL